MSPLEPDVPPAGEEIHIPGPSILPLMLAVGLTLSLIGVTISLIITAIGLAITIPVLIRWVRSTREDIDELPAEH
ncbi:MAG: hypothetical protein ACR2ND_13215 [Solirubrobacteraceae bacterium]